MTLADHTNRARHPCEPAVLQAGLVRRHGEPALPPRTGNFGGFGPDGRKLDILISVCRTTGLEHGRRSGTCNWCPPGP
ncbi:hypothetical protein M514_26775 [Trichuris suis]|uniref:Uncharacterized protein n=1 Tax=Trichuris suis TaxID=68888 RepID=A0A085MV27_9BILA|nr:hypothetical protein M514_26775 [Trichuris suis]